MTDTRDVERDKMLDRMALDHAADRLASLATTIYASYLATTPSHITHDHNHGRRTKLIQMALEDAAFIRNEAVQIVVRDDELSQPPPPLAS